MRQALCASVAAWHCASIDPPEDDVFDDEDDLDEDDEDDEDDDEELQLT